MRARARTHTHPFGYTGQLYLCLGDQDSLGISAPDVLLCGLLRLSGLCVMPGWNALMQSRWGSQSQHTAVMSLSAAWLYQNLLVKVNAGRTSY